MYLSPRLNKHETLEQHCWGGNVITCVSQTFLFFAFAVSTILTSYQKWHLNETYLINIFLFNCIMYNLCRIFPYDYTVSKQSAWKYSEGKYSHCWDTLHICQHETSIFVCKCLTEANIWRELSRTVIRCVQSNVTIKVTTNCTGTDHMNAGAYPKDIQTVYLTSLFVLD